MSKDDIILGSAAPISEQSGFLPAPEIRPLSIGVLQKYSAWRREVLVPYSMEEVQEVIKQPIGEKLANA